MGNYLYAGIIRFHLAKEQFTNALFALTDAAESYDGIDSERADKIVAYMANTIYSKEPIEKELAEVIGFFNWTVNFDQDGNIDDIYMSSDYPEDEERLFELLSPFVTQGSYIAFESEQYGNRYEYRYAFTGTRMVEQEPRYDSVPDEREKGVIV